MVNKVDKFLSWWAIVLCLQGLLFEISLYFLWFCIPSTLFFCSLCVGNMSKRYNMTKRIHWRYVVAVVAAIALLGIQSYHYYRIANL